MSDLKPCPFCGCDKIAISRALNYGRAIYKFHCWKCGAVSGCSKTEKGAVEHWNTRPAEDKQTAEIEQMKEALTQIGIAMLYSDDENAEKIFKLCKEKAGDALKNAYVEKLMEDVEALGTDTDVPAKDGGDD